ncbi:tetratricopeptide repeat protein [Krasilnikovia sp. MM14-A1004]|uniref:tetratricopeptide repeat protein n=1 Tax=Krasilnikovia sp. MM14-A1004 TaxID=3373541 RepID=UPI00399CD551
MTLPDPGRETGLDGLIECLRALKTWAGNPSYETITGRVNAERAVGEQVGRTTVVDCFRLGRRRLDSDLVSAVVIALHPDPGYVNQWRQALRVITGEVRAAAQVRVQDVLPRDLPTFTGRESELARIRDALDTAGPAGATVAISALEGMAGAGKTQLAVHLAHRLIRDEPFDHVLFVNLRGFHPDPAQPPADPTAVLDGFLRLLGVPGQQIPHRFEDRITLYRQRLSGRRALLVLDNAADEDQVGPLLPEAPGCVTLITSRRNLAGLRHAARFAVDVFTPDESQRFLTDAITGIPVDDDPGAAARIADRCGHLPLALALLAGHLRTKTGWTLADHAAWLDERHGGRRLDTGVELALDVSYRNLPAAEQRLLRALALHPGQDVDLHAAAALNDTDLAATADLLETLSAHHLVQGIAAHRYGLHDLVRAYAAARAADEDRRADRRAALTRLLDHYLAAANAATTRLDPAEADRLPPPPASPTPLPDLTDPAQWLDTERTNLVAAAAYAAHHDRPGDAVAFSAALHRYFVARGHQHEALTVHGFAARCARDSGDVPAEAAATLRTATTLVLSGQVEAALAPLTRARRLFLRAGDESGQGSSLNTLGIVKMRLGKYDEAAAHLRESVELHRRCDDMLGLNKALTNLACLEIDMGRDAEAVPHFEESLHLCEVSGDEPGVAITLCNMGGAEARIGHHDRAQAHLTQALRMSRELGILSVEGSTLDFLGILHTRRGEIDRAVACHREAMVICKRVGHRYGELGVHNGLGEAANAAGRHDEAIAEHTAAYELAQQSDVRDLEQQARAQLGLGVARQALGERDLARCHYERARELWADMNPSMADRMTAALNGLDRD